MATLNLGCGNRILAGAINHNLHRHRPEVDVVWDLNDLPWPWQDEQFTHINAWAVLEHLRIDLLQSMDECWRLLVPEGILDIKLPYWNSDLSHADPTHRWLLSPMVFDQFDPDTDRGQRYSFYTDRKWKILGVDFVDGNRDSFAGKLQVRK